MPESSEYTRLGDGGNQSLFGRWQYLTRLEKGLILITTVFGVVIFSLAVALAKCDAQVNPTPPPSTTTVKPNVTTVAPTTSSVAPNTSSVAPSSSTVIPSSSSVAPSTTSVKPSSTSTASSTSSIAPSSSSTASSSSSVAPSSSSTASSSSSVAPSSSTTKKNETETVSPDNLNQLSTEPTIYTDAPIAEDTAKLLKNIPPIPVTGIKIISPENKDSITEKNLIEKEETIFSKNPENIIEKSESTTHAILSRKKRIDLSATDDSKRVIYQ